MAVQITGLVVGAKVRPGVEAIVGLVSELWEEELVSPHAIVRTGKTLRWDGTDLPGLVAAIRDAYAEDVAIWFERVDADAFESADEDEDEDDFEDEGDEGDDAPASSARGGSADEGLGEFEIVPPSLCIYSVRTPVELEANGGKKPKRFGPRAVWATIEGEDADYFLDDLPGSWLLEVLEDVMGRVEIGIQRG